MKTRDMAEMALLNSLRSRDPTVVEPRIEIHQQPVSAADAARLYGEIRKKAEADIIETTRLSNTDIECVVYTAQDLVQAQLRYRAIVKINHHTLTVEHAEEAMDPRDWQARKNAFIELGKKLAEAIAMRVMADAFQAHDLVLHRPTKGA